jgi:very-short-patch-repair endonuclease
MLSLMKRREKKMPFKRGTIPYNKGKKEGEWEKAKIFIKNCPFCKKEIKTKRSNQIYCNILCYSKSEKLHNRARNSDMIKNNLVKRYHLWHKFSEDIKEKIRNSPTRHSFPKGQLNPGFNKSKETIAKIKEKRLYQKILKKDTQPEIIIQNLLDNMGMKFIKHKPITNILHKYQCDIFINPNIIIECDGDYYHNYPESREVDKIRTKELKDKGYKVLRFWENQIHKNLEFCKSKILEVIQ